MDRVSALAESFEQNKPSFPEAPPRSVGMDLGKLAAEIYGREGGLGHGRGGHMHLFDPATHFSCSGIIAEGYQPLRIGRRAWYYYLHPRKVGEGPP